MTSEDEPEEKEKSLTKAHRSCARAISVSFGGRLGTRLILVDSLGMDLHGNEAKVVKEESCALRMAAEKPSPLRRRVSVNTLKFLPWERLKPEGEPPSPRYVVVLPRTDITKLIVNRWFNITG